ncbi:S24 family peptidase [Deltaproteobacteria bacterium TL4]
MTNALTLRFRELVQYLSQGNRSEFAELTGKSLSYVSRIYRGLSLPSMKYLLHLSAEYEIDLNWLLKGEGTWNPKHLGVQSKNELVYAPLYDVQASAGYGSFVQNEEIQDYLAFKKSWLSSKLHVSTDSIAMLTVSGESMESTLYDGDMILVDLSYHQFDHEGIFVLEIEDSVMTKRLRRGRDGEIRVSSDNPGYPEFSIKPENTNSFHIVGKVVWFGRKI